MICLIWLQCGYNPPPSPGMELGEGGVRTLLPAEPPAYQTPRSQLSYLSDGIPGHGRQQLLALGHLGQASDQGPVSHPESAREDSGPLAELGGGNGRGVGVGMGGGAEIGKRQIGGWGWGWGWGGPFPPGNST